MTNKNLQNYIIFTFLSLILTSHVCADIYGRDDFASATAITSPKCNEFTFDATESRIPDSEKISYDWDFGDGSSSMESIVTHTYERPGTYEVILEIKDHSGFECSTAVTSQKVRATIPPKASFTTEEHACVNKPILFEATANRKHSGRRLRYDWDFGDAVTFAGDAQVKKTFRKGGDYTVRLTVNDQIGSSCSEASFEKIIHINEPPIAQAGEDVLLKCVTDPGDLLIVFDASQSTDANNDPLTYYWDFGDGHRQKGVQVSHRYPRVGNYDAKLIVSDNTDLYCGTGVDFVTVRLNAAPKADAGEDIVACVGDDIDFDGSASYIRKAGTVVAQWSFGDGIQKHGLNTTHRYRKPGTYEAELSLENKLNHTCPVARDTRTVTVNSAPVVQIQNPESGCTGNTIIFDAASTIDRDGDNLIYYWNFGDGNVSKDGAKVSHQYAHGGNYRVSVIVDDQKGSSCSAVTAHTSIVINTIPIAHAQTMQSCCVDRESVFSAKASNDPDGDQLTFTWDLGDGTTRRGETITHSYKQKGSYHVELTVDDGSQTVCSQSTDTISTEVKETPVPVINVR